LSDREGLQVIPLLRIVDERGVLSLIPFDRDAA
jgi:hypothetical protein